MFNRFFKGKNDRWVQRNLAIRIELFFIGAPRSGTTLLGQVLNQHPNVLISTEHRLLDKVLVKKLPFDETLREAATRAYQTFLAGLEKDPYFHKRLGQYQSNWSKTSHLAHQPEFKKRTIEVAGDKKAGGTAMLFHEKPEAFRILLESRPQMKFVHIYRDPISAATSLQKSHGIKSTRSAIEHILHTNEAAFRLKEEFPDRYFGLQYEKLLADPAKQLASLLGWLELPVDNVWLNKTSVLFNPPTDHPNRSEKIAILRALLSEQSPRTEYRDYLQ